MIAADRRAAMRLAAVAALSSLGATRALAGGDRVMDRAKDRGAPFVPPAGPMQYTRTLVRDLGGGYSLSVERAFAITFAPTAGGFAVTGRQTDVAVEAPEALAGLAALERGREETRLFPLALDPAGRIEARELRGGPPEIDRIIAATRQVIEARPLSAGERAEANRFMQAVHQSAMPFLAHLPVDLFAPAEPRRVEERAIDLPGPDGLVRVEFVASIYPATGLMRSAAREVVTLIGGEAKVTREDWTLTPL